ncbi:uncharacterized protein LOC109847867 [Asparagus officinalis]|uniref:uncharacterized protein LOC109847867 n=1 Tax=Asparagus officinalis TaxID=4686 RepID=UPI00098E6E7F|nr:uncharacterized protein LOC109847867 [Asparagus officinalis]
MTNLARGKLGPNKVGKKSFKNQGHNKGKKSFDKFSTVSSTSLARENVECFFYKKPGHMKRDCLNYKQWLKKKGGNNPQSEGKGKSAAFFEKLTAFGGEARWDFQSALGFCSFLSFIRHFPCTFYKKESYFSF